MIADYVVSRRSLGFCMTKILFDCVPRPMSLLYPPAFHQLPPPPPTLSLIPTNLRCGGYDEFTAASVHLGVWRGWVDTLGPCVYPRYHAHPCFRGRFPHDLYLCCNDPIILRHPTAHLFHGLRARSSASTNRLSRESDLHRGPCASECAQLDSYFDM